MKESQSYPAYDNYWDWFKESVVIIPGRTVVSGIVGGGIGLVLGNIVGAFGYFSQLPFVEEPSAQFFKYAAGFGTIAGMAGGAVTGLYQGTRDVIDEFNKLREK